MELVVKVGGGSSKYEADMAEVFNNIFGAAIKKMSPKQILVLLISAGLMWTSSVAWKAWLEEKAQEHQQDTLVKLTQEETKRQQLLVQALGSSPIAKEVGEAADEFRNDSLNKLDRKDALGIPNSDVEIDGDHAAEITHKPREQSMESRLDGKFVILAVTSGETQGFKLKVKEVHGDRTIVVTIPDGTLTKQQAEILKNSEWAKSPVYLEMNVRILRGQITSATLYKVTNLRKKS